MESLAQPQDRKLADIEEYGIPLENSDSDSSYSSSSSDTDRECYKSDLARTRARGKRALPSSVNKGKKAPEKLDLSLMA